MLHWSLWSLHDCISVKFANIIQLNIILSIEGWIWFVFLSFWQEGNRQFNSYSKASLARGVQNFFLQSYKHYKNTPIGCQSILLPAL